MNIRINNIILLLLFVSFFISCTKEFKEINTDPHDFANVEPTYLLTNSIYKGVDRVSGKFNNMVWAHYAHYTLSAGGAFGGYWYDLGDINYYWKDFYVRVLNPLEHIIQTYPDDPEYSNAVQIAKVWKNYMFSQMIATWGGLPYSEALKGENEARYEKEGAVIKLIMEALKVAADSLNPDDKDDKPIGEPLYKGDIKKWIKLCNTIRLKLALRYVSTDTTYFSAIGKEIMADEDNLVSSSADEAIFKYGTTDGTWHYFYDRFIHESQHWGLPYFNHLMFIYLRSYNDPRISVYAQESEEPYQLIDTFYTDTSKLLVKYPIPYLGRPKGGHLTEWQIFDHDENPFDDKYLDNENWSIIGERFLQPDFEHYVMTHAEASFMKAEAALNGWGGSKQVEDYYYEGIDAAFNQYGLSSRAEAYKAQDGIKWGTSGEGFKNYIGIIDADISDDPLEKIVVQRWISRFFYGFDAYCLHRRTQILPITPHFAAAEDRGGQLVNMPMRFPYPTDEAIQNGEALAEAQSWLSGNDDLNTLLDWVKPIPDLGWDTITPDFNFDALAKWYGDSLVDLDNFEISYEIMEEIMNSPY